MEMLNTELDAVNLCLAGIGREPVASLGTPDLDSAMALSTLQWQSHDIQLNGGQGWWFNRERNWKLFPDNVGRIKMPNNVVSILEARCTFFDQGNRLAVRDGKVYDTDQHTYDLRDITQNGSIEFTLLTLLQFNEIPASAKSAIAWSARLQFSDDVLGDVNQHKMNQMRAQRAYALLDKEHRRSSRSNYLTDNQRLRWQLGSIGGNNNMYQ